MFKLGWHSQFSLKFPLLLLTIAIFTTSPSSAQNSENWSATCAKVHQSYSIQSEDAGQQLCAAALAARNAGSACKGSQLVQQLMTDMCEYGFTSATENTAQKEGLPLRVAQYKLSLAETLYGKKSLEYWHALMDLAPFDHSAQIEMLPLQLDLQVNNNKGAEIKEIIDLHSRLGKKLSQTIDERFKKIQSELDKLNKQP